MSTIKSSDEHLTLNADGSGNDIKFQSNGSEVASISDAGKITATNFAANADDLEIQSSTGEKMIKCVKDAQVNLYYDNSVKLATSSTGVTVTGGVAIGGTGTANTLDDYEEGSWSPAYQGSGGSAGSLAHTTQEGYYTKVGRLVTCQYNLTLSNRGSWSGEVRLTGLPFTPADTFPAAGSVGVHKINYSGGSVGSINVYVNPGVSYFRFMYSQDNDNRTFIQVQDCHDDCQLNGIISYIV